MFDILDELQEDARACETTEAWFDYIKQYGEALQEQENKKYETKEDAVQLLTMHGAKGLEYEIVFLPDVNEGVAPHNKAVLDADVEEERRLFYVAMTRAKTKLIMSYVKTRLHHETDPSRFLDEIFPESAKRQT